MQHFLTKLDASVIISHLLARMLHHQLLDVMRCAANAPAYSLSITYARLIEKRSTSGKARDSVVLTDVLRVSFTVNMSGFNLKSQRRCLYRHHQRQRLTRKEVPD